MRWHRYSCAWQNCAHPPWALGNFSGTFVLRVSLTLPVAALRAHLRAVTAKFKLWKTLRYVVTYLNLKNQTILATLLWSILLSSVLM
jgi:hypothetical protein